jgi:IS5 family transposase
MVPLSSKVMKQTRARIFRGDTHAEGKILRNNPALQFCAGK